MLKSSNLILFMALLVLATLVTTPKAKAASAIELTPTLNHHVAELNSNQPYVAGYHVNTPDLFTRERVEATVITVSFPLTGSSYFPPDSWLGAGMFVQAQDSRYTNVDYGFYMMLTLEASGDFFIDLGLHQTRESTAPIQMPTEDLMYAYTWRISGVEPAAPITLLARWDEEGFVHYSLSSLETDVTITSINVAALPNCDNIIRRFYAGDAVSGMPAFPFGHYVYYFQFGIISSRTIDNTYWSVDLKEPKILRKNGWNLVETAWSTQGDSSYLDYDWKWGGVPYAGVSAQYYGSPLENRYETIFFYNGHTLTPGTILWEPETSKQYHTAATQSKNTSDLLIEIMAVTATVIGANQLFGLPKKAPNNMEVYQNPGLKQAEKTGKQKTKPKANTLVKKTKTLPHMHDQIGHYVNG